MQDVYSVLLELGFDVHIESVIADCNFEALRYVYQARPDVVDVVDEVNADRSRTDTSDTWIPRE